MSLVTCTACRRLVRDSEPCCPFCGGETPAPLRRTKLGRTSRALLVSAAVALGPFDGCSKVVSHGEVYGGPPPPIAVYGGPPMMLDAGAPVPPPTDAGADADAGARSAGDAGRPPPHPKH